MKNIIDRFLSKVKIDGDCEIFTGATNNSGYGYIFGRTIAIGAHIFSYEMNSGNQVPKGYEPHHKCRTRNCIKFEHLKLLSLKQNRQAHWTHCKRGHLLSEDNTIIDRPSGRRRCKICRKAYAKSH